MWRVHSRGSSKKVGRALRPPKKKKQVSSPRVGERALPVQAHQEHQLACKQLDKCHDLSKAAKHSWLVRRRVAATASFGTDQHVAPRYPSGDCSTNEVYPSGVGGTNEVRHS